MSRLRPIFCGNFEYGARPDDIERLFDRYGKVDRVDMKTGFAFVYMLDERDGADAIKALHDLEHGRRRLVVQWAKGDGSIKQRELKRKQDVKPTCTLFVVNFDPAHTRDADLERHFSPYGRLVRVQIKKNFAFVQFETVDSASKALEATHLSSLDGRVVTVEYVAREDNVADRGAPPPRGGDFRDDRSGRGDDRGGRDDRGGYGRERSPPRRRSPEYSAPPRRTSPVYERRRSPPRGRSPQRGRSPPREAHPAERRRGDREGEDDDRRR